MIIVEESERIGKTMEANTMVGFMTEVEKGNIRVLTSTRLEEVVRKEIIIRDKEGNQKQQEVDSVIVALDLAPTESDLVEKLKGKVPELYMIGDAKSFERIINAVSEGYTTACKL